MILKIIKVTIFFGSNSADGKKYRPFGSDRDNARPKAYRLPSGAAANRTENVELGLVVPNGTEEPSSEIWQPFCIAQTLPHRPEPAVANGLRPGNRK